MGAGRWAGVLVVVLVVAPGARPADDPEEQRRLMELPPAFEMQLVACEPVVINPIAMNFDPQGRLWVACAPRYPQLLPGQEPADYVVVLDDFDDKGRARSARVFAEGLTMPTGLAPGDGGVYVSQGDALWHLRDAKGTGKADERRMLLCGFGTQDTHHTLNTFRWGPDGALYFNQGVYIKSTVETPFGPRRLFGGCVWQLRTDRLRLEVYDRSILDNNTWGHAFDAWGRDFLASAWPDGINLVLPDSPLHAMEDRDRAPPLALTRIGDGRHCGLEIVGGRHFPDDWQGDLLTGDFLTNRVQHYRLHEETGRFRATPLPPLVVSRSGKFRPVDVKTGPDGAVYIADLHQEIIQHNQIDFRDPRRDHTHGRIWRIVRKDRPLLPKPRLTGVPVAEVLDHLKGAEPWTRAQAKRALAERSRREVAAALAAWVERLDPKDSGLEHHLLEALWTCQGLDEVNAPLLLRLLRAEDPRARAAATRVLGAWADRIEDATRLLAKQAADADPRVRLEAVLAAARVPSAGAAEAALHALEQPADPLVEFALRRTVTLLKPYWYPEFRAGRLPFGGRALAFALQAAWTPETVPAAAAMLRTGKVPRESMAEVLCLLAALGDASHQALALDEALTASRLDITGRIRVLETLRQAARERPGRPAGNPERITALWGHEDASLSAAAVRLAGAWKLEKLRGELGRLAAGPTTPPTRRQAAVAALVDLGGPDSVRQLNTLAGAEQPYVIRAEALAGLAALDLNLAARRAASLLRQPVGAAENPSEVFTAFLQRRGGPAALAAALQTERPSADAARVGLRVVRGLGVPAPRLAAVLQAAAGEASAARQLDAAGLRRFLERVRSQGDAARGEAVFRRGELSCLGCHAIAGAGGRVGPDLATIGSSAPLDYLLESILSPGKVVKDGYAAAAVVTGDGRAFTGVVLRESPRELVLRDPTRDEIVIPVAEIEERSNAGSLMPAGLDAPLTDAELADLVRFLSELGRPGPYGPSNVAVARRWQYLTAAPAQGDAALGKVLGADGTLPWASAYSLVSGDLPLAEVNMARQKAAILRCQIEVATPGKVELVLNDVRGLTLWVDGERTPAQARTPVDLEGSIHTVAVRVDTGLFRDSRLRCELAIPAGSQARASFLGGR
jgi:putative heme-binding domain-containing protein